MADWSEELENARYLERAKQDAIVERMRQKAAEDAAKAAAEAARQGGKK